MFTVWGHTALPRVICAANSTWTAQRIARKSCAALAAVLAEDRLEGHGSRSHTSTFQTCSRTTHSSLLESLMHRQKYFYLTCYTKAEQRFDVFKSWENHDARTLSAGIVEQKRFSRSTETESAHGKRSEFRIRNLECEFPHEVTSCTARSTAGRVLADEDKNVAKQKRRVFDQSHKYKILAWRSIIGTITNY